MEISKARLELQDTRRARLQEALSRIGGTPQAKVSGICWRCGQKAGGQLVGRPKGPREVKVRGELFQVPLPCNSRDHQSCFLFNVHGGGDSWGV
jgi:hypothetical protein